MVVVVVAAAGAAAAAAAAAAVLVVPVYVLVYMQYEIQQGSGVAGACESTLFYFVNAPYSISILVPWVHALGGVADGNGFRNCFRYTTAPTSSVTPHDRISCVHASPRRRMARFANARFSRLAPGSEILFFCRLSVLRLVHRLKV